MMSCRNTIIPDILFRPLSLVMRYALRGALCTMLVLLGVLVVASCQVPRQAPGFGDVTEASLFDGKTLGRWKITDFGGQGDVYVKDGRILLDMGDYLTGINWPGPVIRMNYEISLEAMRVAGYDFFCGLTFPVDANSCSLILGGWGGEVCGLSSLDYYDASENETTRMIQFETGRWYRVRVRVTPGKIEAWLDDEKIVDVETTGRNIDVRFEMEPSKPLGIASYCTTAAIRNIHLRKLTEEP